MEQEHTRRPDSLLHFTTTNYGLTTWPAQEWRVVLERDGSFATEHRRIPDCRELLATERARRAGLKDCEVMAVVLYTGPMFQVYNLVLRRWPVKAFEALGGNHYCTTIYCLVSGVTKISRVTPIPRGLVLYRGLGGVRLPERFYRADACGHRAFVEWGFMSTTADRAVAVQYTGVAQGRAFPTLLMIQPAAVDHGGDIGEFSQYPGEREYLWNPCSLLEPAGEERVEATPEGIVTIIPVRMNMNVKTMTVEELLGQKKSIHLSGFQFLLDELHTTLLRIAGDGNAELRLQAEMSRSQCYTTVKTLVKSIVGQCRAVFLRHRALKSHSYADDETFTALLGEMQAAKARAHSKLRLWLEDSGQILSTVCDMPLLHAHRSHVAFLERRVASEPPERRACTALELCKLASLLVASVGETNELGENPLIQAVANGGGVSRGAVALLAQAGVDLEATDRNGNTAAGAAAWRGEGEALRALGGLGVDVQRVNPLGFSSLHLAVSQGHLDAAQALVALGASVNAAAHDGSTPLLLAVVNCQPKILAWFCELRAEAGCSGPAPPASAAIQQALATPVAVSSYNSDYFCNVWQCILHGGGGGGGRQVSVHFSVFGNGALGPLQGAAQSRLFLCGDGDSDGDSDYGDIDSGGDDDSGDDDDSESKGGGELLLLVDPCFVTETPDLITGTLTYALPDALPQPETLCFSFGLSGYSKVEVRVVPPPPPPPPQQQHLAPVVDVGAVDHRGRTALVLAADNGRADLVRLLAALGAGPGGVKPAQA